MSTVFKLPGARKYTIVWTDENGKRHKKAGYADRTASKRLGDDLERKAAMRRDGLIDPEAEAFAQHEALPLADHVADHHAYLLARGNTASHANQTRTRVLRVVALLKGASPSAILAPNASRAGKAEAEAEIHRRVASAKLSDLTADRVQGALALLRAENIGLETLNGYLRSIKAFSRWAYRVARRTRSDRLEVLALFNAEPDHRHVRRALSDAESARLIRAAENGPIVLGMSGRDRAVLYRLALGSGLRANEIRSLTTRSFRLDATPPVVACEAGQAKNRRRTEQPLSKSLASLLTAFLADREPDAPAFPTMPKIKTAELLRADLLAAGIAYETAEGKADFHCLRASFITSLIRSGASVKTTQTLARHSTPVLTIARYAKVDVFDLTTALESLPDPTTAEAQRATPVILRATKCAT